MLVGREKELAQLVVVYGRSSVCKSTLLREFFG